MLNGCADRGIPLTRKLLIDVVALPVCRFSEESIAALLFKSGRPGLDFIRAFEKRHAVLANGFIDTAKGAVLTSETAMELAREKERRDETKRRKKQLDADRHALAAARRSRKERDIIAKIEWARWTLLACLCRKGVEELRASVRSTKERREIARIGKTLCGTTRQKMHPSVNS